MIKSLILAGLLSTSLAQAANQKSVKCGSADGQFWSVHEVYVYGAVPVHPYPVSRTEVHAGKKRAFEWTVYSDGSVKGDQNLSLTSGRSTQVWSEDGQYAKVTVKAVEMEFVDGTALAPIWEGDVACTTVVSKVFPPSAPIGR